MQATSITYKEALGLWTVALCEGAGGRGCRQASAWSDHSVQSPVPDVRGRLLL